MSMVLTDSRDDVFRFLETGTVSPAQVVEFMRTSSAPALKLAMDEEHRNQNQARDGRTRRTRWFEQGQENSQEIYAFVEVQRLRRGPAVVRTPGAHMVFRGNLMCFGDVSRDEILTSSSSRSVTTQHSFARSMQRSDIGLVPQPGEKSWNSGVRVRMSCRSPIASARSCQTGAAQVRGGQVRAGGRQTPQHFGLQDVCEDVVEAACSLFLIRRADVYAAAFVRPAVAVDARDHLGAAMAAPYQTGKSRAGPMDAAPVASRILSTLFPSWSIMGVRASDRLAFVLPQLCPHPCSLPQQWCRNASCWPAWP